MDAHQSEEYYQQADELYRDGRYAEALSILGRLDKAYPNTKNILMPAAMCMAHLGQLDDARALYERLAEHHPPERLVKLRNLIEHATLQAAAPMDALDAVLNINASDLASAYITPRPHQPPPIPAQQRPAAGPNRTMWAIIGGAAVVLVAFLSIPLFYQPDPDRAAASRSQMTVISGDTIEDISPEELMRFGMIALFLITPLALLAVPVPLFLTLQFFGELPRESFLGNFLVLFGYMFLIYFVGGLVFGCLGIFLGALANIAYVVAILLVVNKIFELGFARTMIFAAFTLLVSVIQVPIFILILRAFSFEVPIW